MSFDIREKKSNGALIIYNNPALLAPSDKYTVQSFLDEVTSFQSDIFRRFCRANKMVKATELLAKGFVDVHRFGDSGQQWSALFHVSDNRRLRGLRIMGIPM